MPSAGEIEIRETSAGCQLRVHVRPGAKRSAIEGVHGGALKIAVKEAPEKGKATRAALRLVGASLGIAAGAIQLVSGAKSREKLLHIEGLSASECRRRLGEALSGND